MEQVLPLSAKDGRLGVAMDTVKVTYIGRSGRRRARGRTESYWFRRHTTLRIPASDIETVTGSDPENWQVERPKIAPDAIWQNRLPTPTLRRRSRRGATTKEE